MPDLLLELFSEEIPARMQLQALSDLRTMLAAHLQKAGVTVEPRNVEGFVTPRRLAVWVKGLPVEQAASETELKGPKASAPEAALQGFLKKNSLQPSDLVERDGTYFATVKKEGQRTADVLKTAIEDIMANFPWPKSMRWGSGAVTWVRPLHSILCLFDGKVVPVSFGGINASNTTRGHRFLSPDTITITTPQSYEAALEKAHVIASRDKRKANILAQAQKAADTLGLKLIPDVLEEVTGLVEWPVILVGTIDARFMDLPKEVLVSEMRAHQKYFALENSDGSLSEKFLITSNMKTTDGGKAVIAGNERVLRARLADGRFFWDQDRKKTLDAWAEGLKNVTFHAKLGTIADKVERISKLASVILSACEGSPAMDGDSSASPQNDKLAKQVARAAALCKADLVTGMVGEFPELQGVMGRYYAIAQKESADIADAIRDHYKPQGPGDSVPTQPVAICIALADKLDTLVSMFAIGEKPTGSKDPFALRRSALGIIRIILENKLRISLRHMIGYAGMKRATDAIQAEIFDFFIDRLKVQMKDSGIRHDVINAVTANGDDDLVRIIERAKAVQDFLGTDNGANLLAAYKRAANILSIEEKKDNKAYDRPVDASALTLAEEKTLNTALNQAAGNVAALLTQEQFIEAMAALSALRTPVDSFFDKVLVNDKDAATRELRLNLLSQLRRTLDSVAHFALIEGDIKEQKKAA